MKGEREKEVRTLWNWWFWLGSMGCDNKLWPSVCESESDSAGVTGEDRGGTPVNVELRLTVE